MPDVEKVRVSPDGRTLAWIGNDSGKRAVLVHDLGQRRDLRPIYADDKYRLRDLAWADESTLLITISFTVTLDATSHTPSWEEFRRILVHDIRDQKSSILHLDDNREAFVTSAELLRIHTGRPGIVTIASEKLYQSPECPRIGTFSRSAVPPGCFDPAVFDVNWRTGQEETIAIGPVSVRKWIVDPSGRPVGRVEWWRRMLRMEISVLRDGAWQRLYRGENYFDLQPAAVSADGTALVAIGPLNRDKSVAWSLPLDGRDMQLLFESDADIESVIQDQYTGAPVGFRLGGLEQRVHWVDPDHQRVQSALERAFPGQRVVLESRSADFKVVVAGVQRDAGPVDYYVIDRARGTADLIGESYPALVGAILGKRRGMYFEGRDGLRVPAYFTLPAGSESGAHPLVVLLHDGISGRDTVDFDWRAQFLATRGYAVLQPQFRGSSGFGSRLQRAGKEQWAGAVLDDVIDGVQHLIDQKVADGSRICIIGEGYGGYVALANATRSAQLFSCVASINGISDLREMYRYFIDNFFDDSMNVAEFWERVGNPFAQELDGRSPRNLAGNMLAPALLLYATDDPVIPPTQSREMARALQKHERKYASAEIPQSDHSLTSRRAREVVLTELEEFLSDHL